MSADERAENPQSGRYLDPCVTRNCRNVVRRQQVSAVASLQAPCMTEWNAREYSRRSALQKWLADKSLTGVDLDGSERVLDVGCGAGVAAHSNPDDDDLRQDLGMSGAENPAVAPRIRWHVGDFDYHFVEFGLVASPDDGQGIGILDLVVAHRNRS